MSYEVYFGYQMGSKSHVLRTDSRRVVAARLNELLTQEAETREMADRVVMTRNGNVILDMPTSASNEEIIAAARFPAVGHPRRIVSPVTLSLYIPKAAGDYLRELGNGSPSNGLRHILLEIGGEEMAKAYMVDGEV